MKKSDNKTSKKARSRIKNVYVLSVGAVLLVVMTIILITWYLLIVTEAMTIDYLQRYGVLFLFAFILASALFGIGFTYLISLLVLRPVNAIINGLTKLSDGDYSARLTLGGYAEMKNLAERFNSLAQELQNTEILRSDFINNFSHEFKTPLVSVRGLIALLNKGNVPADKQKEYYAIILDEIDRLTEMSTNVLNLSKIENQNILTDVNTFNLSEQIRSCLLLLEKKWAIKNLELSVDFDEYEITANEDMLKQVWFNLIDNAVKYANDNGKLEITVTQDENVTSVCVSDEGLPVSDEDKDKIFNKFYRAGKNDFSGGNGIGLSIVKHIVELHDGSVSVSSTDGKTAFTVVLPNSKA